MTEIQDLKLRAVSSIGPGVEAYLSDEIAKGTDPELAYTVAATLIGQLLGGAAVSLGVVHPMLPATTAEVVAEFVARGIQVGQSEMEAS